LYKATSGKDGKLYTLRRLEGYRLTNEKAIIACRAWKRVDNGTVVNCHDAFTTRQFGDPSLIFVTDYHPNSKTIGETHLQQNPAPRFSGRPVTTPHVPENVLWSYVVQIASALKAIHGNNLAAQTIVPSKVLVTSKNRLRLNGCGILDVVNYDRAIPLIDLQQQDFEQLGRLILSIASNANATLNVQKAFDHLTRTYTARLKECVTWLLQPQIGEDGTPILKDIDTFLGHIATDIVQTYDAQLHADDALTSTLMSELENGRLVRLMTKLGLINERPEYEHNPQWSETGERYYLKLFRDYVFHAVDADGKPVVDLGHVMGSLAKLDAGTTENVQLTSRDDQSVFVVSYKEVKKGVEAAFQELVRGQTRR
jgi:PAB-dependent poly(A)-specific ribonuclease subunit 3